jgi:outer membrane protein OmpA-like peptidoglycan-associated protein
VKPEPQSPPPLAAAPPAAARDRDGDGVADGEDQCPILPGPADNAGCPRWLSYDARSGRIALARAPRFEGPEQAPTPIGDEGLAELKTMLLANPELRARVEAHMMRGKDADKTQQISVARAAAVRAWLIASGVAAARLEAFGCGSKRPLAPDKRGQREKNERVELWVIDPLPAAGMRSSLGCTDALQQAATKAAPPAAPPPPPPPKVEAPKTAPPTQAGPPAAAAASGAGSTTAQVAAALAARPAADADGDGVANAKDQCPLAPGPTGAKGCPETHRVDLDGARIELLKPIRFDAGSAQVAEFSRDVLVEVAATLRANAQMQVRIASYVAAEGTAAASLALTRSRAAAVRKQLAAQGVATERMTAYGCGDLRPVAPNNVPWGRKRNDRIEIDLVSPAPGGGLKALEACAAAE